MLDLQAARAKIDAARAGGYPEVKITTSWLEQALAELSAARAAQPDPGKVFNRQGPAF